MPVPSPVTVENIFGSTHSDEEFPGYFANEWEVENKHIKQLDEVWESTPSKMLWHHPLRPIPGSWQSHFVGPNANVVLGTSSESAFDWLPKHDLKQLGEIAVPTASVQVQIYNCIAARPHESIKLFTKLGIVTLVFMLLVYFVGGVLIVNPVVAVFGIFGCVLFWTMAKVDERIHHRR